MAPWALPTHLEDALPSVTQSLRAAFIFGISLSCIIIAIVQQRYCNLQNKWEFSTVCNG
jgi:hypothetical protein